MVYYGILFLTLFFYFSGAIVSIYLIRITKKRIGWVLISSGLLIIVFLRLLLILNRYMHIPFLSSPWLAPIIGLFVSLFLFTGLIFLIPVIKTIKNSEARYHSIFNSSGVSLWEEDLYDLFMLFEKLKSEGVVDLRDYLAEHPDFIDKEAIKCMKVLDVNQSTLDLFKSKNKEKFLTQLSDTFTPMSRLVLIDIFVSIYNGGHIYEAETQYKDLEGKVIDTIIKTVDPIERKPGETSIISITDISARVQAERKLITVLDEKNTVLKELYHRTKNNMQVIIAMLNLRSYSIDNEIVSTAFNDMIGRIQSMALVHEKLYKSENLSLINLDEYINDLMSLLINTETLWDLKIKLKLDLESVSIDIDRAIPCGLILNELVSNTNKHAFKNLDSGEVIISLKKLETDEVEIIVADNGNGLPAGFDIQKCDTLGLQTVFALGEDQLNGIVEIISLSGYKGSAWRLVFSNIPGKPRV